MSLVGVVVLAVGTYKGVEYMESVEFCGTACHTVMQPEYTAHQRSAHSRVACADCHIGAGADWFVKSKLSGSWQLIAVAFNLYPTPIPTPVHNLRPARETCEQCHWPTKFTGDKLRVRVHYADDEKNTETAHRADAQGRRPARPRRVRHPLARGPGHQGPVPVGRRAGRRSTTSR